MKYTIFLFTALLLNSCVKNAAECEKITAVAPAAEVEALRAYLSSKGITATEDYRGFFYIIDNEGTGSNPTTCNNITTTYTGKLTDDSIFDSGENVQFALGGSIIGWKAGIPLIKEGGSITLYLPPSMAYGTVGAVDEFGNIVIPPNSILIFEVDLTTIN